MERQQADRPSAVAISYAAKDKAPIVVAKGYGAVAVGTVWSWYETWLSRVREECQQHPARYKTAAAG